MLLPLSVVPASSASPLVSALRLRRGFRLGRLSSASPLGVRKSYAFPGGSNFLGGYAAPGGGGAASSGRHCR